MRKLDTSLGKIYHKNDFYYLEKIYDSLIELIEDEDEVKDRARRNGFKIMKTNWVIEENPNYIIESIINDGNTSDINEVRFVFKIKLEYTK